MDDAVIEVSGLSKVYKMYQKPTDRLKESLGWGGKKFSREFYALKNVDIRVRKGETVGIIGTNGSGKSTLLKIVTGVLDPTAGSVSIHGRVSALLELGAGFNMEYTGLENIYLNGTMMGFSDAEIEKKVEKILAFADIGDFVYQPVKTYSSGMFVRLAFAVAINIEPEILIVDEALSVGDIFFQAKCYRKFEEFKEMGKTILFVSHDLSSVSKYCDRVILLNKGEKVAEGNAKEIVDLYKKLLVNQAEANQGVQTEEKTPEAAEAAEWKTMLSLNPEVLEYGEREAEIIDFAILDEEGRITNSIEKGSRFRIRMKVLFHEAVQDPIFAYTIKNRLGTELTGTNTMYEKVNIPPQKPGDIRTVSFEQEMELQGGEYLLSLGCTGYREADFRVYHRLYDLCSIVVISDKNTVGFFDMKSEVLWE